MPFADLNGTESSDCLLRLRRTHRGNGSDSWRTTSQQADATAFIPFIMNSMKDGHPYLTSKCIRSCIEADRAFITST
ncbi:hypothetical protein [Alkalicoccus luteus]|uniref:hypothetical protein n=1 Tax=Alkalicoccus luteus TaxID=1237094 RepID=UPI00143C5C09|nr:hypothetical protein [Alkalicoccus luteus]